MNDNYFTDNFIKKDENSRTTSLVKRMVEIYNHNSLIQKRFVDSRRHISEFDRAYNYSEDFVAEKICLEKFKMELLKSVNNELPIDDRWVIFQLHGGGYVNAFKNRYRMIAKIYSKISGNMDVLSVDYRVAPKDTYPAALEDAVSAYEWLVNKGYKEEHIIAAGDSAGGGLAIAMCLWLRDNNKKLPAAVIGMSPWTDVSASGASYKEKFDVDLIFGNTDNSIIFNSPYPGKHDPTEPYISPIFSDMTGLPPMLIQVGTEEMLYDDSRVFTDRAREKGVNIRFTEYENMFHVFQLGGTRMPEAKLAWKEVQRFIKKIKG